MELLLYGIILRYLLNKRVLLLLIPVIFLVIIVSGYFLISYNTNIPEPVEKQKKLEVQYSNDKFNEKLASMDSKIKEKIFLMNKVELLDFEIEYSYCTQYEEYLKSVDFPGATGENRVSCLEHLDEFLDKIE